MSNKFDEVLNEASASVVRWPEWRKSDALRLSEKLLREKQDDDVKKSNNKVRRQAASG
jgi:hypothetical protein